MYGARSPISLVEKFQHVGHVGKIDQCFHVVRDMLVLVLLSSRPEASASQFVEGG
jgi:hypothetical protein